MELDLWPESGLRESLVRRSGVKCHTVLIRALTGGKGGTNKSGGSQHHSLSLYRSLWSWWHQDGLSVKYREPPTDHHTTNSYEIAADTSSDRMVLFRIRSAAVSKYLARWGIIFRRKAR